MLCYILHCSDALFNSMQITIWPWFDFFVSEGTKQLGTRTQVTKQPDKPAERP